MNFLLNLLLIIGVIFFNHSAIAQEGSSSPSGRYSVSISKNSKLELGGIDDSKLIIYDRKNPICSLDTYGYLQRAVWSPDGHYVAINNRRSNSGDYLWIIHLPDGILVRKPVDALNLNPDDEFDRYTKSVVKTVQFKYPKLTFDRFEKCFTYAQDWLASSKVKIITSARFSGLGNRIVFIEDTYSVSHNHLSPIDHQVVEKPSIQSE